ncbi:hypothetical protein CSA37_03675 [Candidatus Fermentibacteria bacterium]|nr:MAG: hypothetical protein CSA37_03675 [Candidatus Fermentibacteria bacterium]
MQRSVLFERRKNFDAALQNAFPGAAKLLSESLQNTAANENLRQLLRITGQKGTMKLFRTVAADFSDRSLCHWLWNGNTSNADWFQLCCSSDSSSFRALPRA